MNDIQYKYTCTVCGAVKYGNCTLNTSNHAACNSAKFGLWEKVWLNTKDFEEKKNDNK